MSHYSTAKGVFECSQHRLTVPHTFIFTPPTPISDIGISLCYIALLLRFTFTLLDASRLPAVVARAKAGSSCSSECWRSPRTN
ncbi:hypothetical protein CY34DRAFT_551525 [Suillus luteus UH-Slu-Lm8-n1]|uniref:Uncharacterized protein n=1 Tax=Suillus luteus UH-Slu-Lm8-n1 TaxID=930992 RepID=A0A0D0A2J6_9AGAM|nr:hypothetical protein CY34DRAFT_551525 [Suillus luteus UH-Slu-Lm8-n1]